jgi:hypothetical protein
MDTMEPVTVSPSTSPEPFWLRYFTITVCCALDVDLSCLDCGHVIGNFNAQLAGDNTLEDFKYRAYEHMEECGK